jgi:hypothetical protein
VLQRSHRERPAPYPAVGEQPGVDGFDVRRLEVVEANRERLRSGDPDLIYPGETVVLPD